MKKKCNVMLCIAAAVTAAIGTVVYLKSKEHVQLNVTELENAVMRRFPNGVINSIEKTMDKDDIYLVKMTVASQEYMVFVTSKGEIINTSPNIE